MMPNPYLSEKLVQAHHEDLLHEAEQQRRVAQLPEPGRIRHTLAARLVLFSRAKLRTLSVRPSQGVPMRFE